VLGRLADELPVLLGQLPGGFDGLATAGGEEDPVEVAGRVARQPVGQLDRPRVGVGPQWEEGQLAGLRGGRLGQFLAAVADLDDEQPSQAVEVAAAGVVPDVGALAPGDHRDVTAGLVRRVPGEMHPETVAGGVGEAVGAGPVGALSRARAGHRVPQL
jgi:hypothetical protein